MALIRAVDGLPPCPLDGSWELNLTAPGACAGPDALADLADWLPAPVPGTVAAALRAAGRWSQAEPTPLHDRDAWYRTRLAGRGRETLRFEGLATLAEIWLDGACLARTRSMFVAEEVGIDLAPGAEAVLALCFRSLGTELARPHGRGRGRWRPRMATPGSLRHVRTSLLGFMPGWCPSIDAVGPYRPVTRRPADGMRVRSADLATDLDGDVGRLRLSLTVEGIDGETGLLRCAGREAPLRETAPGRYEGSLDLPGVAPWWPHTHGTPVLHAVEATVGPNRLDLGRVGFRRIERAPGDALSLRVNGVPVFARGACWTPPDLVGLGHDEAAYRPTLELAREAGMTMLRVGGTMLYEGQAFHDLCDELGILVWQDLMLANFDYPTDDPAFRALLEREVEDLLDRTQGSPSLCVVGGGSEVAQQAAMLGFPRAVWEAGFGADALPALAARWRPGLVTVPNSPYGGDLPFTADRGAVHYYGVGAYLRPLEDARRARVGFASECLAFANVPEPETLREAGLTDPADPRWAAAIPRDRGADWEFEGVRDHYLAELFGADPVALRRDEPERYLALARAASAEVMEATFAEWRRAASPTAGGLVWFLRDLSPGAGWGVIDAAGRPKSAWYALRRALRPVQVTLSDEGVNGLHVHLHNETAQERSLTVRLAFTDGAGRRVAGAERGVALAPRASQHLTSGELLGRFFDATNAYRFGPPAHDLGHAALIDPADGAVLAEAFHFPQGRDASPRAIGLGAELLRDGDGWSLAVASERHALCVAIDAGPARPDDTGFHLAPGGRRIVRLAAPPGLPPRGTLRALNASEIVSFGPDDT